MYGRIVKDIPEIGLPLVGTLADGTTVSNYHLLPPDVLAKEGWLPLTESKPTFDSAAQELVVDSTTADASGITIAYKAVDKVLSAAEISKAAAVADITKATTIVGLRDAVLKYINAEN